MEGDKPIYGISGNPSILGYTGEYTREYEEEILPHYALICISLLVLAGAGCGGEKPMVNIKAVDKTKIEAQFKANGDEPDKKADLANPATTKCFAEKLGLKKYQTATGVSNICIFDDGTECDEWAYFRGECKKGDCKDWETCPLNKTAK